MGSTANANRLVLENREDEDGLVYRAVTLDGDGSLTIEGQDTGAAVERVFRYREYEFERTFTAAETAALRGLLDVPPGGDLLAAIGKRFTSAHDLEEFVKEHAIGGEFWNRIGD